MGKEKVDPPVKPKEETTVKAGKGHRQRGSGTVITAKPAVVTHDGIVLKPHERLPFQLLQEYCQKEKRPNPKYFNQSPSHRFQVLLEDPKSNSKNDLHFTPIQSFPLDSMAKDYAALLALFHFQKKLPLESKLPEPYSSTWRQMLLNEKDQQKSESLQNNNQKKLGGNSSSSSATSTSSLTSSATTISSFTNDTTSSNIKATTSSNMKTVALSIDSATSDWLCEQCGSQNFANLANGQPRTNCFKCRHPKSNASIIVTATATSTSMNNTSSITPKVIKTLPTPVLNLRSVQSASSNAEKQKLQLEQKMIRSRKNSYFDALRKANCPMQIMLNPTFRQQIEKVLKLDVQSVIEDSSEGVFTFDEYRSRFLNQDPMALYPFKRYIISPEYCYLSMDRQLSLVEEVVEQLKRKGFEELSIIQMLLRLETTDVLDNEVTSNLMDLIDDEELTDGCFDRLSELFKQVLEETCLEQLCLNLNGNQLPTSFDVQKTPQQLIGFEVVRTMPSLQTIKASTNDSNLNTAAFLECLQQMICQEAIQVIDSFIADCLSESNRITASSSQREVQMMQCYLIQLIFIQWDAVHLDSIINHSIRSHYHRCLHSWFPTTSHTDNETMADTSSLSDELESLDSIFANQLQYFVMDDTNSDSLIPWILNSSPTTHPSNQSSQEVVQWIQDNPSDSQWIVIQLFEASIETSDSYLTICFHHISTHSEIPSIPIVMYHQQQGNPDLSISHWIIIHRQLQLKVIELTSSSTMEMTLSGIVFELYTYLNEIKESLPKSTANSLEQRHDRDKFNTALEYLKICWKSPETDIEVTTSPTYVPLLIDKGVEESQTTKLIAAEKVSELGIKPSSSIKAKETHSHSFWVRLDTKKKLKDTQSTSQRRNNHWKLRQELPAFKKRDDFLFVIKQSRAIVVTGETGCGKTTQIPQFIHEEHPLAKIVICQPRRLAAVGVAARVAEEMNVSVGDKVGHMVKGDVRACSNTVILFCTYGVILRRLQDDPTLSTVDYIILDEVHERGIDSDFTLALLIAAMNKRKNLKLILMSATISTEKFADYLGSSLVLEAPAPILFIPGYTFSVTEFYKSDFEEPLRALQLFQTTSSVKGLEDEYEDDSSSSYKSRISVDSLDYRIGGLKRKGDLDYDLLIRLVFVLSSQVSPQDMFTPATGSILIFLPGVPEINRARMLIESHWDLFIHRNKRNLIVILLHGNLSTTEQQRIFQSVRTDRDLKIVLSTNIAEASVTIPDTTVVIDSCKVKEMGYDEELQTSCLITKFAAHDSLRQRRGRAGRVQEGRCYRMITKGTYDKLLLNAIPEILRSPLEGLMLQIRVMESNERIQSIASQIDLFQYFIDCPTPNALNAAQQKLIQIQALSLPTENNSNMSNARYEVTSLGRHIAGLPCEPHIGRLLIYGSLLGCAFHSSCVAACLMTRSPFLTSQDVETRQKIQRAKERFQDRDSNRMKSDYNLMINAVKHFLQLNNTKDQRKFCQQYGLQYDRMIDIRDNQKDLIQSLLDIGFVSSLSDALDLSHPICNKNATKSQLVNSTLCAGLYPNLAKIIRPPKKFVEVAGGAMERDNEAKEMKFYIPSNSVPYNMMGSSSGNSSGGRGDGMTNRDADIDVNEMNRVFIHPSSVNFDNATFRWSHFVLYGERLLVMQNMNNNEMKKNTKHDYVKQGYSSKLYIKDTIEVSSFALLFFGGKLETQFTSNLLTIDGWIRFSAPGRVISIIKAIRFELDKLLNKKLNDPAYNLFESEVLDVICNLLELIIG